MEVGKMEVGKVVVGKRGNGGRLDAREEIDGEGW